MAKTREQFADDLDRLYSKVIAVVEDAMVSTRKVRIERDCMKCGCKHIDFVEVPNEAAAMKAAEFLTAQGVGRPPIAEGESAGVSIVIERVNLDGSDDSGVVPAAAAAEGVSPE